MAITPTVGTRASVTVTSLSTLANGSYATSNAITPNTNKPVDVIIELEATPGTVAAPKQAALWILPSMDGTNYATGGTSTADDIVPVPLGVMKLPSNTTQQRKAFSVFDALGFIPYSFKVAIKNDSGSTFSAAALYATEISIP